MRCTFAETEILTMKSEKRVLFVQSLFRVHARICTCWKVLWQFPPFLLRITHEATNDDSKPVDSSSQMEERASVCVCLRSSTIDFGTISSFTVLYVSGEMVDIDSMSWSKEKAKQEEPARKRGMKAVYQYSTQTQLDSICRRSARISISAAVSPYEGNGTKTDRRMHVRSNGIWLTTYAGYGAVTRHKSISHCRLSLWLPAHVNEGSLLIFPSQWHNEICAKNCPPHVLTSSLFSFTSQPTLITTTMMMRVFFPPMP